MFFFVCVLRKPTTRKGKKVLINREPKLIENPKNTLFIQGRKCSGEVKAVMKDFYHLKKPMCKVLTRTNDISPFEDSSPLEQ